MFFLSLTSGDKGGDPDIRRREFVRAAENWGGKGEVWGLPDLMLEAQDKASVTAKVVNWLRKNRISKVVTFSPIEITYGFDHPDHNFTGEVVRWAATGANVHGFFDMGDLEIPSKRPELYFWTSAGEPQEIEERLKYMKIYYPSQHAGKEFESIINNLGESYLKVR